LKVTGKVTTFKEGAEMAMNAMSEGLPMQLLSKVAQITQEVSTNG